MKKIYTLLFIFFCVNISHAQLNVSTTGTVANWVQNILTGNGVVVTNVTFTGAANSIGKFTTGPTAGNLGFSNGLVISTGNVTQLPGSGGSFCSSNMGTGSDPQLAGLITQSINDAAVLEFDFTPIADTVKFRYVFGSEEYPEFVNSINDVFGFFISGLSPFGGFYTNQNIALIPNTTTPITINNVNNVVNFNYYVNNANGTFVQLDGFTTVLTAWIRVFPCVTYHIKIAIGDAADHIYDSGVFLEANSFSSNMLTVTQTTSNTIDTLAVEGCNDAVLTFKMPYPRSLPTAISYTIGGTAINGVDYTTIGNSVTIPAGQDSVNLIISPITDTLVEPLEYITLIVNTSPCTQDTINVFIKDNMPPLANVFSDTTICGSSSLDIISTPSGGYVPYTYLWSTGDTTSSITVTPSSDTTYSIVVTDFCNNDSMFNIDVGVSNPDYILIGDSVCEGDTAILSVNPLITYDYLWSTGAQTQSISVSPNTDTQYIVTVTDSAGCEIIKNTTVKVYSIPIVQASSDTIICRGDEAYIKVFGNYSVLWNTGSTNSLIKVSPSFDKSYSFIIKNVFECENNDSIMVEVVPIPTAEIYIQDDTVCLGKTIVLQGSGGDEYMWNSGVSAPNMEILPTTNATYTLTVTNENGGTSCSHDTSVTITVERCNYFYFASAFTPNGDGKNDTYGVGGQFEAVNKFDLYIYNRWGKQVFHATEPDERWDGTFEGKDVPDGVYTYVVYIDELYRDPYSLNGTITLYR